jgi:hypothetical protein
VLLRLRVLREQGIGFNPVFPSAPFLRMMFPATNKGKTTGLTNKCGRNKVKAMGKEK